MDKQSMLPQPGYIVDLSTGMIHHVFGRCLRFKFFHTLEDARKAGFKNKCQHCLSGPFKFPAAMILQGGENAGHKSRVIVRKRHPGEIVVQSIPDRSGHTGILDRGIKTKYSIKNSKYSLKKG